MNQRTGKTVITIETRQKTMIYKRRPTLTAWCGKCASEVPMMTPNEAAAFFLTTAREIFRLTEAGAIHFLETETGALLVCRNSCQPHRR